MGNYYLAGTEYVTSDPKEMVLADALAPLLGRRGTFSLKTGQHTSIWRGLCTVERIVRREERIEEGHLTVDQVAFQMLSQETAPGQGSWEITFPVDQFIAVEEYPRELSILFQGYTWSWRPA
ncbi:hypothetical protein H1S01_15025 [Heliobacterium chlorum]|uniref:Uncharacterized protein n=1 Tax=Heliobacterium chlorum TaxID=2698 RepID=A0ABR7T6R9_HELCL|nr:hypothetical protein [Heliobacterium chlorum]MBC9785797.1 hypothetical protein [Heliobacterium chlorum]